jgi:hypothetical protein
LAATRNATPTTTTGQLLEGNNSWKATTTTTQLFDGNSLRQVHATLRQQLFDGNPERVKSLAATRNATTGQLL